MQIKFWSYFGVICFELEVSYGSFRESGGSKCRNRKLVRKLDDTTLGFCTLPIMLLGTILCHLSWPRKRLMLYFLRTKLNITRKLFLCIFFLSCTYKVIHCLCLYKKSTTFINCIQYITFRDLTWIIFHFQNSNLRKIST